MHITRFNHYLPCFSCPAQLAERRCLVEELQGAVEAVVGDVGQVGPAGGVAGHVGREGSWVEEGIVEVSRLHPPGVHP